MNFSHLSTEVILMIFSYLDTRTLACRCATVSRTWRLYSHASIKQRDNNAHEDLLLTLSAFFVDRSRLCARISDHVESFVTPLVVTGANGSGKSSLLANWIAHVADHEPRTLLLYHFVGCDPASLEYHTVIKRFMRVLKDTGLVQEEIPSSYAQISPLFSQWLQVVAKQRDVVIVIDALDMLFNEDGAHSLNWLPSIFPPNVKLIVSTNSGTILKTCLNKKGYHEMTLLPFSTAEKVSMISKIIAIKGLEIHYDQLDLILSSPQTSNPLYLSALLGALSLFRCPKELSLVLANFLRAETPLEFFVKLLEFIQARFASLTENPKLIGDILGLVHVTKHGVTEKEILEVLSLTSESFSQVSRWLEPFVVVKRGLMTFRFEVCREAVDIVYLSKENEFERVNKTLAAYFQRERTRGNMTRRVLEELPWLLERAADFQGLKECLTDLDFFEAMGQQEKPCDLFKYWSATSCSNEEIVSSYLASLAECERKPGFDPKRVALLTLKVGEHVRDSGNLKGALPFFQQALVVRQKYFGEYSSEVAQSLNEIGRLYYRLGKNAETLEMWEKSFVIRESLHRRNEADVGVALNNLGLIYHRLDRFQDSELAYRKSLKLFEDIPQKDPDISVTYHNLGLLYSSQPGQLKRAEEMYLKSLAIKEAYYGKNHTELAMTLNNLGLVYAKLGQYQKAIIFYQKALNIKQQFFGDFHPDIALFLFNLGTGLVHLKNYEKAKVCLIKAYRIRKEIFGAEDDSTHAIMFWIQHHGWAGEAN